MYLTPEEIVETLTMITQQHLDVRTITLGLSLSSCADSDIDVTARRVYDRVTSAAERLVPVAEQLEREYGIPIVNKRIAVTPIAQLAAATQAQDLTPLAMALDRAAAAVGIDFIGGFSALVQKGVCDSDGRLIASIPGALAATERVCASVNVATTRAGINMDAVLAMAETVLATARRLPTATRSDAPSWSSSPTWSRTTPSWPERCTVRVSPMPSSTWASPAPGWCGPWWSRCPKTRTSQQSPRRSRRPPSRSPAWANWSREKPPSGWEWREASSTSRSPPLRPRATRSPGSSRRWGWAGAAARERRRRSRCSTTP